MTTPLPQHTHPSSLPTTTTLLDRYPLLDRLLPPTLYAHLIPLLSETLATTLYLFLSLSGAEIAFSPSTTSSPPASAYFYASLTSALALGTTAWCCWKITSGLFNPAVTVGMCVLGRLGWGRGGVVVCGQMLGGMVAGGLVRGLVPGDGRGMESLLRNGMGVARGFFLELFLTAVFVFAVFVLAADRHKGTFLAPLPITFAALITHLIGTPYTSASLNPARAFGAAVAARHFPTYHAIYWFAPLLGGLLAAGMWKVVKRLEVETTFIARGRGDVGGSGEGFWGHRRGESRGQSERVLSPVIDGGRGMGMGRSMEGHVLQPVEENDLEKGEEGAHDRRAVKGGVGVDGQPKPRYVSSPRENLEASHEGEERSRLTRVQLSGLTAVHDASDSETASREFHSPRTSVAGSGGRGV